MFDAGCCHAKLDVIGALSHAIGCSHLWHSNKCCSAGMLLAAGWQKYCAVVVVYVEQYCNAELVSCFHSGTLLYMHFFLGAHRCNTFLINICRYGAGKVSSGANVDGAPLPEDAEENGKEEEVGEFGFHTLVGLLLGSLCASLEAVTSVLHQSLCEAFFHKSLCMHEVFSSNVQEQHAKSGHSIKTHD